MRTIIYVDGFNLYYRQLKKQPALRWLNIKALAENILSQQNQITAVKFYTARVSDKIKPGVSQRQQVYFNALQTIPEISVHLGNFQIGKKWAGFIKPHNADTIMKTWPDVVRVRKIEEKGSDVNLGAHLVRDAFQDKFDVGVVLSNDTDLIEPMRIVAQEVGKPVGIICPVAKPAEGLNQVASFMRHIRPAHLRNAQFPDDLRGGKIKRPAEWTKK